MTCIDSGILFKVWWSEYRHRLFRIYSSVIIIIRVEVYYVYKFTTSSVSRSIDLSLIINYFWRINRIMDNRIITNAASFTLNWTRHFLVYFRVLCVFGCRGRSASGTTKPPTWKRQNEIHVHADPVSLSRLYHSIGIINVSNAI